MKSGFLKRKTVILIGAAVLICTVSASVIFAHSRTAATPVPAQTNRSESLVAGPGRVEPTSEDIKLGSELSGKLKAVYVEEGDTIRRGQVLAELENDDYRAQVASAEADVTAKEATLRKVVNGARSQERLEAWSSARAAEAVMNNARSEMERRQKLF
jgi:HlyD family secretion protein